MENLKEVRLLIQVLRFEDGKVVGHKAYGTFKKGEIAHQSLNLNYGS